MIVSCANLYSLMARKDIYTTWITSPLILLNLLLLLLFRGVYAVCVSVVVVCTLCKCNVKWKLQKLISTWNDWNKKKKIKERRLWTSLFELHGFGYVSSECVPLKRSVAEHRPYWVALMDSRCGSWFHTLRTYVHFVHAERWRGYWRSSN